MIFNQCYTGQVNKTRAQVERERLNNKYVFTYNGKGIDIVHEFKYLGCIFYDDVMYTDKKVNSIASCRLYDAPRKFRIKQARKSLATWIRRCKTWMLNTDLTITLFKTGAMPALEYGVGLWGVGCVNTKSWEDVEVFWRSVARYILHAPVRTPSAAIMGDLGWLPFRIRAGHQAAKLWCRISKMDDVCLARKAMHVQRELVNKGKPCWLLNFRVMLASLNECTLDSVWSGWISNNNDESRFLNRLMSIKRLRFDTTQAGSTQADHAGNGSMQTGTIAVRTVTGGATVAREETISVDRLVEEALIRQASDVWRGELDRDVARHGNGGNKLRTYRRFKSDICLEQYLLHVSNESKRALMFKFRSGIAPLRIETGRYEASRYRQKGIPVNERICFGCALAVEDEEHFLCVCPVYKSARDVLFDACNTFNNTLDGSDLSRYIHINSPNQFVELMKADDANVVNSLASYIWDAFQIREQTLNELRI